MQKVCIVRHGYYPSDPRLKKEAAALVDKGLHVDVVCLKRPEEKARETIAGVRVYRINIQHLRKGILRYIFEYSAFFCLATFKLCRLYFCNRYDFIQVNTLPDFLVFVSLIPKLFGARVILDLHEPTPELWNSKFKYNKFMFNTITFFEQISIQYADRAITVSKQMRNNFISRGASPSKISVILNVPDDREFNPDFFEFKLNRHPDKQFTLITHGAIMKRYGQDLAIEAVALLKEKIPSIRLDILGYGDYVSELKDLVRRLKLENYVHFHGFVPFDKMIAIINNSDIGLVPVEKNDYSVLVHTNKMFEYIAMKKPVIISRIKAVEEFFGADDACLKYFKPGDKEDFANCVIELYNNPKTRQKMVENALAKFRSVSWDVTKEEYCSLFTNYQPGNNSEYIRK
jgi:glycosyltransferase involved in cell wall biosynthesis